MPKVTRERTRRFLSWASLRAVMLAFFCLVGNPPHGSPSTSSLIGPNKLNRSNPRANIFEFALCERVPEEGARYYGDCTRDLMTELKEGKADEPFETDVKTPAEENEVAIWQGCKDNHEYCDVVKIKE